MVEERDKIVEKIVKSITVKGNKIKWDLLESLNSNRDLCLLFSELENEKELKAEERLNDMKYKFDYADFFIGYDFTNIFKQMKDANKYTYDALVSTIDIYLNDIKKIDLKNYKIYYAINAEKKIPLKCLKIADLKFSIKSYKEIENEVKDIEVTDFFTDYMKRSLKNQKDFIYIETVVSARNYFFAMHYADEYLKLLLSLIVFVQNQGKDIIFFGEKGKSTLTYFNSYFFYLIGKDIKELMYFSGFELPYKFYSVEKEDFNKIKNLIETYNKFDDKTKEVIRKSFANYHEALLQPNVNYSFLYLWVSLETILMKNKESHQSMIKKLKGIINNFGEIDNKRLSRLYNLRNNLIHDGSFYDITQLDRNLLKNYVDLVLKYYVYKLSDCSYPEIQEYLNIISSDKKHLMIRKKVIEKRLNDSF